MTRRLTQSLLASYVTKLETLLPMRRVETRVVRWRPKWTLAAAPKGDDEQAIKDFYYQHFLDQGTSAGKSWRQLEEWQRESWRREYRNV